MRDAKKGRKLFSEVIAGSRNKTNFLGTSASLALCPMGLQPSKNLSFCFRQTGGRPGVKGFEPLFLGIKGRCLTTWLYSKKKPINQPYTRMKSLHVASLAHQERLITSRSAFSYFGGGPNKHTLFFGQKSCSGTYQKRFSVTNFFYCMENNYHL